MADMVLLDAADNELTNGAFGSFEEVPPGSSYIELTGGPLELKLKNASGVNKLNRELYVAPEPPYAIAPYVGLSADGVSFAPTLFLGDFAPGETKTVFLDAVVPEDAAAGPNQRCRLRVRIDNGG